MKKKGSCRKISEHITQTDNIIDKMVYDLYGITEEEIKVIEKS